MREMHESCDLMPANGAFIYSRTESTVGVDSELASDVEDLIGSMPTGKRTYEIDLPPSAFDTGAPEFLAPKQEISRAVELDAKMAGLGLGNRELLELALGELPDGSAGRKQASRIARKLHDAAALLYLQWSHSHIEKDHETEHAAARLFNRMTAAARQLDSRTDIFDKRHMKEFGSAVLTELGAALASSRRNPARAYTPHRLARALEKAARKRTHNKSWPWVVLPTFDKQHYGRILLGVVQLRGMPFRAYIVQPTFTDGEATLFHTHGQNWGLSRPLGRSGGNRHINTMWEPFSKDMVFPLRQVGRKHSGCVRYCGGDTVAVAPRTIHGIAGCRESTRHASIDDAAGMTKTELERIIARSRFGELSCLHVYMPDIRLAEEFMLHPIEIANRKERDFFDKNDMIVFDHNAGRVWSGIGGAWEQRLMKYGPSGGHCGICFRENDPRRFDMPESLVLRRFLLEKSVAPLVYN